MRARECVAANFNIATLAAQTKYMAVCIGPGGRIARKRCCMMVVLQCMFCSACVASKTVKQGCRACASQPHRKAARCSKQEPDHIAVLRLTLPTDWVHHKDAFARQRTFYLRAVCCVCSFEAGGNGACSHTIVSL